MDGRYLPGPWLIIKAMETAELMARSCGTGTVVIRCSNHIACLAAYLKRATDQDLVVVIESSDPATKSVAPYGGLQATHTPNPIAVGYPTASGPVLLDVSTSITTNGMVGRLHKQNSQLPYPWLKDHQATRPINLACCSMSLRGASCQLVGLTTATRDMRWG